MRRSDFPSHDPWATSRFRAAAIAGLTAAASLTAADFAYGPRLMSAAPVRESSAGGSDSVLFPFFGGQAYTLHQLADLDGDGDLDLFLQPEFDWVSYFENVGTPQRPEFRYRAGPGDSIGYVYWFAFSDFDRDGDSDLVYSLDANLLFARLNEGDARHPIFGAARGPLQYRQGPEIGFLYGEDIAIADADCDGFADITVATVAGSIRFYRNAGILRDGLPVFEPKVENYLGLDFGQTPPAAARRAALAKTAKTAKAGRTGKAHHGTNNTLAWADLDRDGDWDLVYGDFYDPGLALAENVGTCREPAYAAPIPLVDTAVLRTTGGNLARFGDLDGDGAVDLIVSNLQGARSEAARQASGLHFLRNAGIPPVAARAFVPLEPAPFSTVDAGANSSARFVDIDGDGDDDLFLTTPSDTGAVGRSGLVFYRNAGTASAPSFIREDQDFLRLPALEYASLAFGDLDGDGDPDLLVGNFNGTLAYFENGVGNGAGNDIGNGAGGDPVFVLADSAYMGIDVGQKSVPALADLDGDGDLDLVIGEARGLLRYYVNDGDARQARFSRAEIGFQGMAFPAGASPALGDVDGDGDFDLVVGGDTSRAQLLYNAGTPREPRFSDPIHLAAPFSFTPCFVDFDGDGDADLAGGSLAGGVVLFGNTGSGPIALPAGLRRPGAGPPAPAVRIRAGVGPAGPGSAHRIWTVRLPARGAFDARGVRRTRGVVDRPRNNSDISGNKHKPGDKP